MNRFNKIIVGFLLPFIFGCHSRHEQLTKLFEGIPANALRVKLKIPVIETYMIKAGDSNGRGEYRWDSQNEIPPDKKVLHAWKISGPYNKADLSIIEEDAFRKKLNDSIGQQINISFKIKSDLVFLRSAELIVYRLRYREDRSAVIVNLNEKQTDSLINNWGLSF